MTSAVYRGRKISNQSREKYFLNTIVVVCFFSDKIVSVHVSNVDFAGVNCYFMFTVEVMSGRSVILTTLVHGMLNLCG